MRLKRGHVRIYGQCVMIRNVEGGNMGESVASSEKCEDGGALVELGNGVRQGFYMHLGMGLLTKKWC